MLDRHLHYLVERSDTSFSGCHLKIKQEIIREHIALAEITINIYFIPFMNSLSTDAAVL